MSEPIQIIEAVAVDERHIELKEPLSERAGKNFKIAVLSDDDERKATFEELKQAYLAMTDEEIAFEVNLAEEGLRAAPEIHESNGESERWWE